MRVLIIDYGMGNTRSVANAFEALGCTVEISQAPEMLTEAEKIVLPGVGAFGDGMNNLLKLGWVAPLENAVLKKGIPFLGICLGMQLLAQTGTEGGVCAGLNWIEGSVERLPEAPPAVRIPHIGWNEVTTAGNHAMYRNLSPGTCFYFVHSYAVKPQHAGHSTGTCSHGTEFVASIAHNNIWGTQFHPEKSQKSGLTVLKNFLECCHAQNTLDSRLAS